MSLQKKCLTASAITHGLLLLLVFVGSAFIPAKPKIEPTIEFEIFRLPDDVELVADDNVLSGGNPNARKGTGLPEPEPKPVTPQPQPQPQPKQEPPKQEVSKPEVPVVKPPETKPEPKPERVEKPAPKIDPEAFDLSKTKKVEKPEPKKVETLDFSAIKSKVTKRTITTAQENKPSNNTSDRETKMAALNAEALANARKNLDGRLRAGGSPGGREDSDIDDYLGPGGARVASYSVYLAGVYRSAWIPPAKSSAREPIRVRVVIARDGTVLESRVISKSGSREFDQAATNTVNRIRKFDKAPPTREPSVTYTIEFVAPE